MKMTFLAIATTIVAALPLSAHAQGAIGVELRRVRPPVSGPRDRSAPSSEARSVPQPEPSRPSWA